MAVLPTALLLALHQGLGHVVGLRHDRLLRALDVQHRLGVFADVDFPPCRPRPADKSRSCSL